MDKSALINICNRLVIQVRGEYSLSQEKMCVALGISKKTLIEIEKGRSSLGWTGSVALCALFGESESVASALGRDSLRIIREHAFELPDTGAKPIAAARLWETLRENQRYVLQRHALSLCYRLVDKELNEVLQVSYNPDELKKLF